MNNSYYRQNSYESSYVPNQNNTSPMNITNGLTNNEFKYEYIEALINANLGRRASIYMSFPDSIEWRDRIFTGQIENMGRDYVLIRDEENKQILLWSIYINFIEFND